MDNRVAPRIKRSFTVVAHSPDEVELRAGVWHTTSHTVSDSGGTGRLLDLITRLDGTNTTADLVADGLVTDGELADLLGHLRELGAVEDSPQSALDHYLDEHARLLRGPDPVAPPVVRLLGDPDLVGPLAQQLTAGDPKLAVLDATDETAQRVLDDPDTAWTENPLQLAERLAPLAHWRDSLLVWAGSRIDPVRCAVLNRMSLHLGTPWIHGAVDGPFLHVGPTFLPGRTACYACFEKRVLMNLTGADAYLRYKRALATAAVSGGRMPLLPALTGLLTSYLALEVVNYAHTGAAFTAGKVLALYLPTWETTVNEVLPVPGCPECGTVSRRDDSALYFDVRAWLDGR
ncbi:bacteriocin biosynthesis cyclodehydratase domain-containing protein [Saccharothrix ecbatanensis]|uniref:Bacteriocin biosynthesis cyclodehydratase domain-containing protein n=1 Tax=Saccharothrix ecbatanensis TaxID=1105145 RepID=A0A7W9M2T1_9PSEU|nr:TOMM precursor leader peptide-binding protein [Saccharothrix ecbatanensis]MBB5805286.1 bacteriocin biosynthesis cyclodehydratase domain-containing protein [Saccharothrix ecbatanensis]